MYVYTYHMQAFVDEDEAKSYLESDSTAYALSTAPLHAAQNVGDIPAGGLKNTSMADLKVCMHKCVSIHVCMCVCIYVCVCVWEMFLRGG